MPVPAINKEIFLYGEFPDVSGAEFVCIINKQGRIEDSIYESGMNISENKKEMFAMGLLLQNSMQSDFDEEFGPVDYTIIERGRSRFISIPVISGILVAKISKSIDPINFIRTINTVLRHGDMLGKTCTVAAD